MMRQSCYLLGIIATLLSVLKGQNEPAKYVDGNLAVDVVAKNLSAAILEMMKAAFVEGQHQLVFNMHAQALQRNHLEFFREIIDETLSATDSEIGVRVGVGQPLSGDNERHYSVLLVDSVESLRFLYNIFLEYHLHISGYHIIVLHNFRHHYYDDLFEMFELIFNVGVVQANVLVYALPNLILLFTHMPFNRFHCKGFAPTIQNKFINSHWQHRDFFPDKLANLYGCPLLCATWQDMPYFALEYHHDIKNKSLVRFVGIEGKLLEYIAQRLNFTVSFQWMTETEIEQTLDDEGAVFHKFFSTGTDFAIGAFHYKPTRPEDNYAPTSPYYLSDYNVIINSSTEPYSPFSKLLFPFLYEIWAILALIFVCGTAVTMIVSLLDRTTRNFVIGSRNRTPLYNMFVVGLGGTVSQQPGRNFARFLLLIWLLATMVLRCAYQALIYHFIRMDISVPPPNTIKEIMQQNYKIILTPTVFDALSHLPVIRSKTELIHDSEVKSYEKLRNDKDHKVAIITAHENFGYFRRMHKAKIGDFHVVQEKVFTQPLSIYMRKNSILLARFDGCIGSYIHLGLKEKWNAMLLDRSSKISRLGSNVDAPQVMGMQQLYGALQLLFFGHILSLLIFIGEFIYYGLSWFCEKIKLLWN